MQAVAEQAAHGHVEHRDQQQPEDGGEQHAADHAWSFAGSSQMRTAYSEPMSSVLPIPSMRAISGWIREARMSSSCAPSTDGLFEYRPMKSRMSGLALATVMPCRPTSAGSSGCARLTLFCTCTSAMSGLVPVAKVRVMVVEKLMLGG